MHAEQLSTYLDVSLLWSLLKHYYPLHLDHPLPPPASARWEDHIAGSHNLSAATGQQLLEDNHEDFQGGQLQLYSDQKAAVPEPGTYLTTSQLDQSLHGTHHEYPSHLNNETSISLDLSAGTLLGEILNVLRTYVCTALGVHEVYSTKRKEAFSLQAQECKYKLAIQL